MATVMATATAAATATPIDNNTTCRRSITNAPLAGKLCSWLTWFACRCTCGGGALNFAFVVFFAFCSSFSPVFAFLGGWVFGLCAAVCGRGCVVVWCARRVRFVLLLVLLPRRTRNQSSSVVWCNVGATPRVLSTHPNTPFLLAFPSPWRTVATSNRPRRRCTPLSVESRACGENGCGRTLPTPTCK